MKIAILSRKPESYSVERIMAAGNAREHKMIILDPLKCFVNIEEGHPALHYSSEAQEKDITDKALASIDAIIPRISVELTFYGASIVRQFEMMNVFTTAPSQAIVRTRDKLRTLQILSKAGVGMPKTAFASNPGDVERVIDMVGGAPVVIKLLEGTQGIGVMLAETKKSAKSIIEAFYGVKVNILIQEFISEANSSDLRVFVVDDKIVGAMKRQGGEGDFRSNLHRGGQGIKVKLTKEERETAKRAVKTLGLRIAGVDMLPSERGPLVMEVNSSPGLEGIEGATEKDIASKIIEFVERNHPKKAKKDRVGV